MRNKSFTELCADGDEFANKVEILLKDAESCFSDNNVEVYTKSEEGLKSIFRNERYEIKNLFYENGTPVDVITLNEFNTNTGNQIEHTKIYCDDETHERTLRLMALAFVLFDDIGIRKGQYHPESEEGRKLLTHELTHVAQNQKKEFVDHRTREELEAEAEANERSAESIQDPLISRMIDGKEYTLPASRWHNVSEELFEYLPQWLDYERFIRPPEEYEILKRKYAQWMEFKSYKYRW